MKLRSSFVPMTCAVAALALLGSGVAQAETRTGWIGPTPPVNGTVYLHTSTIDNGGVPTASTRIYTSFGTSVAPGTMGAKARLFREGALCSATDYRFNAFITNSQNAATTRDCGAGFYNSHGFVAVLNPSNGALSETVTFPTDPLQYPPAALARQQSGAPERKSGVNGDGASYGDALGVDDDADLPDLISAIGTDGQAGYIRSTDLTADGADPAAEPVVRSVPLFTRDGETIGRFEINS